MMGCRTKLHWAAITWETRRSTIPNGTRQLLQLVCPHWHTHPHTHTEEVVTAAWSLSRAIGAMWSHMVVLDQHLRSRVQRWLCSHWHQIRHIKAHITRHSQPLCQFTAHFHHTHHLLDNMLLQLNGLRVQKALKRLVKNLFLPSRKLDLHAKRKVKSSRRRMQNRLRSWNYVCVCVCGWLACGESWQKRPWEV